MQLESCTSKTCWEPCCRQKLILFLMWWQGATSKTCWNTLSCTCAQIIIRKLSKLTTLVGYLLCHTNTGKYPSSSLNMQVLLDNSLLCWLSNILQRQTHISLQQSLDKTTLLLYASKYSHHYLKLELRLCSLLVALLLFLKVLFQRRDEANTLALFCL